MKATARAEYGLRALIDLAAHYGEGPIRSRVIAERQGLPEPYLNQLMTRLRRAGLVTSKRGPTGGHLLSRPPDEISLKVAFEVLEGSTAPWWCVEVEDPDCEFASGCGLRPLWKAIGVAADNVLERLTLSDLRPAVPPPAARPRARGRRQRASGNV